MAEDKTKKIAMYRRWAYMAIAILAAALLPLSSPLSFLQDEGIIYLRSFTMNQERFMMLQTNLESGVTEVAATMPVKGLYYCYWVMLIGAIGALLCMMSPYARLWMCDITMVAAGAYYVLLIIYALRIGDVYFPTIGVSWGTFLPAIVLEMMVLTHGNVHRYGHYLDDEIEGEED